MNATHAPLEKRIDDLAAYWTEDALEMLHGVGFKTPSVLLELQAWDVLREVVRSALRWQQRFRMPPLSAKVLKQQVLMKTAFRVARAFRPALDGTAFELKIRPWIDRQSLKAAEFVLYQQIVHQPVALDRSRLTSRTDYFPHMAMVGG